MPSTQSPRAESEVVEQAITVRKPWSDPICHEVRVADVTENNGAFAGDGITVS